MAMDLENLVRQADEAVAAPRPRIAQTLTQEVGHRVQHRRRLRRGAAVAALAVMLLVSVGVWMRDKAVQPNAPRVAAGPSVVAPASPACAVNAVANQDWRAELAAWEQEISRHQGVVRRLRLWETRQQLQVTLAQAQAADPVTRMDEQVERAALIVFAQGQRFQDEMNLKPASAQAYRQAATLFPQTQWGRLAQARLAGLGG